MTTPLAQQVVDAREVAALLAETLEVILEYPDQLEECARNSLVAYRHYRLDWALEP